MPATHRVSSPAELDDIRNKVFWLVSALGHVLPDLIDVVESVSSSYSPSSSFTRVQALALVKRPNLLPDELLGVAKLTRWLAVIRRDYGEDAYRQVLDEVKRLVSRQRPLQTQLQQLQQMAQAVVQSPLVRGIVPGVYRYGMYNWIAEARVDKIRQLVGQDISGLEQLAIEIFHSLYLVNTDLAEERISRKEFLKTIAEITRPIREDDELRKLTVLDEATSIKVASEIMKKVLDLLKQKDLCPTCQGLQKLLGAGGGVQTPADAMASVLRDLKDELGKEVQKAVDEAKQRKEDIEQFKLAYETLNKYAAGAGIGHRLEFSDKVQLAELLSKYTVLLSNFWELLRSTSREGFEGGSIEFKGYKVGGDLSKIRPFELVYPDDIFDYRLATQTYMTREYEIGSAERSRKKRYIVLIDRSGSMGERNKLEWAKAVALAILMKRDVDDVGVVFFDYEPSDVYWVKKDPVRALKSVAGVVAGGGTDIMRAIEKACHYDADVVLITDGIDYVDPERVRKMLDNRKLITIYIEGHNEDIAKVSTKYYSVEPTIKDAKTVLSLV